MKITCWRSRSEYGGLKGDRVKELKELESEKGQLSQKRAPKSQSAGRLL